MQKEKACNCKWPKNKLSDNSNFSNLQGALNGFQLTVSAYHPQHVRYVWSANSDAADTECKKKPSLVPRPHIAFCRLQNRLFVYMWGEPGNEGRWSLHEQCLQHVGWALLPPVLYTLRMWYALPCLLMSLQGKHVWNRLFWKFHYIVSMPVCLIARGHKNGRLE